MYNLSASVTHTFFPPLYRRTFRSSSVKSARLFKPVVCTHVLLQSSRFPPKQQGTISPCKKRNQLISVLTVYDNVPI